MVKIDCRGLNCPEPVLRTRKALAETPVEKVTILVDNTTARENVVRFAKNQGYEAQWIENDQFFEISITKAQEPTTRESDLPKKFDQQPAESPVLLITTDQLGLGNAELGVLLMKNFIYTLTQRDELPKSIVLMNAGVKLSVEEASTYSDLADLAGRGVEILVCGTCLDYFKLKEHKQVGIVSNMYDITDLLLTARRVITL